jgi:hypothetical protein
MDVKGEHMTYKNSRYDLWLKQDKWIKEGNTQERQAAYKLMSNLDAIVGPRVDDDEDGDGGDTINENSK